MPNDGDDGSTDDDLGAPPGSPGGDGAPTIAGDGEDAPPAPTGNDRDRTTGTATCDGEDARLGRTGNDRDRTTETTSGDGEGGSPASGDGSGVATIVPGTDEPISPASVDGDGAGGRGTPLRVGLGARRGRILAGLAALVVLLAGVVAANAGSEESAPPTTTTTTTTSTTTTTTTTTAPPPPPPVYPLTGLPAVDPAVMARPTLIVKIDNAQPAARPQIGVNQADIVYEERVEGAVTRFMAVFHSHDAIPVGPVRSARTSDIGLFRPFGTPLFAWSGANAIFAQRIRAAGIVDIGYDMAPGLYGRSPQRRAPHNLMLDGTPSVWARSYPGATAPPQLFTYRAKGEPVPGTPTKGVHIVFAQGGGSAPVDYRWNGKGWVRSQSGTPHVDAEGAPIAPENVIVSYTPYANSDTNDQFGVPIREAQLVGRGHALVLTGGNAVYARWVKPSLDAPTQYLDGNNEPIPLTPGRTWVALAEEGTTVFLP